MTTVNHFTKQRSIKLWYGAMEKLAGLSYWKSKSSAISLESLISDKGFKAGTITQAIHVLMPPVPADVLLIARSNLCQWTLQMRFGRNVSELPWHGSTINCRHVTKTMLDMHTVQSVEFSNNRDTFHARFPKIKSLVSRRITRLRL